MTTRPDSSLREVKLPWFEPGVKFTKGSAAWLIATVACLLLEKYGLDYDDANPGNTDKWTLTSNWLTTWGWNSITGAPANVRWGTLRRTIGACLVFWLILHWIIPVPKRGVY
jgi:hypothetical protein